MEEKTKKVHHFFNGDVVFLLVCLVFAIAMLIATRQLHDETATLVPRMFGTLAILFSLTALAFRAASFFWGFERKKIALGEPSVSCQGEEVQIEGAMNLPTAIVLALAYVLLAELVGFIVSTTVIVFAYLWFAKYRRVAYGAIYAVLVAAVLYWLFYTVLRVNLPAGLVPWPWQRLIQ